MSLLLFSLNLECWFFLQQHMHSSGASEMVRQDQNKTKYLCGEECGPDKYSYIGVLKTWTHLKIGKVELPKVTLSCGRKPCVDGADPA